VVRWDALLHCWSSLDAVLQDVPPFKFVLFFGSVLTTHPRYLPAFKERVDIPSCHVIGHKD
jgi:hypothetical protein